MDCYGKKRVKFIFSINGEYVTEKTFRNYYGDIATIEIKEELKKFGDGSTTYLNDELDEVSIYY